MAKDPAMLWYWSDWNSGTITYSRFIKGCYMDVLHAQFNNGHLSLEEIKNVLGSDFGQAWPSLNKKFSVDDAGKYFNERLELEKIKRANYTASRGKNKEGKFKPKIISKSHENHTGNGMDNANRNEDDFGLKQKGVAEFGEKSKLFVTVKAVYINQQVKRIYSLQEYFGSMDQLQGVIDAGWTDFDGFLKANPSALYEDDNHLYHAFKKHCTANKKTNGKKVKFEDV